MGISVAEVVSALGVSRSTLEVSFKASIGRSVYEVIRRIQLERARALVSETNMALKEIAASTRFRSVQHMTTIFGESFGQTPASFRKALIR
jgi:LacI family transcriptional regulator